MKTIETIIAAAGGWNRELYIRIENAPYMPLCIEAIELGPAGLPAISVSHYGVQNGDLMRDPEMCLELVPGGGLDPFYWRNDYVGIEQWSRWDGPHCHVNLHRQHCSFMETWDRNLAAQGFIDAHAKVGATS